MFLNPGKWERRPCKLKDGYVVALEGVPSQVYNLKDHYRQPGRPSLYVEFANIGDSDEKVLEFYNHYGFLGFNNHLAYFNQISLDSIDYLEFDEYYSSLDEARSKVVSDTKEPLDYIYTEVLRMHIILDLLEALASKDNISTAEILTELDQYTVRPSDLVNDPNICPPEEPVDYSKLNPDELDYIGHIKVAEEIDQRLIDFKPVTKWDPFSRKFASEWPTKSLLSAMYAMLHSDLVEDIKVRKCRSETCYMYFTVIGDDERKIYCDDKCARAQAQREYRRRKKILQGRKE